MLFRSVVRFPLPRIRAITSDRFALVQMSAIGGVMGPTKLSDHAFASCSGQRRQNHRRLLHVSTWPPRIGPRGSFTTRRSTTNRERSKRARKALGQKCIQLGQLLVAEPFEELF